MFFWLFYYLKCIWNLLYRGKNQIIPQDSKILKVNPHLSICHVYGTYYNMGTQYGKAMRKCLTTDSDLFLNWMKDNQAYFYKKMVIQNRNIFDALESLYSVNRGSYNQDVINYMKGVSQGSGVPFKSLLFCNLFGDLMDNHCILLSKNIPGGRLNLRTLDYGCPQMSHCLTVFHPVGGYAYLSLNLSVLFGVFSGVSEKNLFFGESYYDHRLDSDEAGHLGMPFHHIAHKILSQAADIPTAGRLLENCKRQSNLQLLLADPSSARIYLSSANAFILHQENEVESVTPNEEKNYKLNSHYLDSIENVIQNFIPRTKSGELHVMITHGEKLYISVTTDILQSYNNTFYEYSLTDLFHLEFIK